MQLARLVETVTQVRGTTKKSEKVRILADALRSGRAREIELTAYYLTGSLPQGKVGIGWNLIQKAMVMGRSANEPLILQDIDDAISHLAGEQGAGSMDRRAAELGRLFSRATPSEKLF